MNAELTSRAGQAGGGVEKLVEYRTAHYAAHSEAANHFTNTPAQVQFRFANPIICNLRSGVKAMRVDGCASFEFVPGDIMYVPPGVTIDVDLNAATERAPIECDCIEIETDRVEAILGRLNETMTRSGSPSTVALDWTAFTVLKGDDATDLELSSLMNLFRKPRDVFSDLRIDARLEALLLTLLQSRSRELLVRNQAPADTGIHAAARLIRQNLGRHITVEELAKVAATSQSSLHRQFKTFFGTTPARFANKMRITEAKRHLRQFVTPVETLAFDLGFSDASHFSRVFRQTTGESPAEYRKRRQRPANMLDWQPSTRN